MTDRESLLRAILTDPKCDTPRLIFADYLDDVGEGKRASLTTMSLSSEVL